MMLDVKVEYPLPVTSRHLESAEHLRCDFLTLNTLAPICPHHCPWLGPDSRLRHHVDSHYIATDWYHHSKTSPPHSVTPSCSAKWHSF